MKPALRAKIEKLMSGDRILPQYTLIKLAQTVAECMVIFTWNSLVQVIQTTVWLRSRVPCSQPATGKDLDTPKFWGSVWHSAVPTHITWDRYRVPGDVWLSWGSAMGSWRKTTDILAARNGSSPEESGLGPMHNIAKYDGDSVGGSLRWPCVHGQLKSSTEMMIIPNCYMQMQI